MRNSARAHGLLFADRACLALAIGQKAPVLTADRTWAEIPLNVDIRRLR